MGVINQDCRAGMAENLADCSVDAIVTDPPYGLSKEPNAAEVLRHWLNGDDYAHGGGGFMGKSWDSFVPGPATWAEAFRVLKPGGYALVFAGSRTQDLMAMALRLAGFEIRDTAMWLYGSGFPKSLDVGKAIDKAAGAKREILREVPAYGLGWGTALKPAYEPVIIARKPLAGTVADNVLTHGTGAINVEGCRIPSDTPRRVAGRGVSQIGTFEGADGNVTPERSGRWPANILHDGCIDDEPWARYFYCAKASKADRNAGLEHLDDTRAGDVTGRKDGSAGSKNPRAGMTASSYKNPHPTVKPTELMRYLCRLVTPPGGLVLDPFAGSGSTGRGAVLEGFNFTGFEMDPQYAAVARLRIAEAEQVMGYDLL